MNVLTNVYRFLHRAGLFMVYVLIKIGEGVINAFEKVKNVLLSQSPKKRNKVSQSAHYKRYGEKKKNKKSLSESHLREQIGRSLTFVNFIPQHIANIFSKRKKSHERYYSKKQSFVKPSFLYKFKFLLIGFILSSLFIFLPLVFFIFISELPNPSNLSVKNIPKTTKILDRNGVLLYEIYVNQNRTIVRLSELPRFLKDATIAIEDKDFYTHPGFDLRGIIRAFVTNIKKEGFQGGSTITQQLIKSAFLTPDINIARKIKEVVLAFWAERTYTKNQILELYFNYVPYGGTTWGASSASEVYFGKKVQNLTLGEAAFLAGLPRAPSVYSPYSGNKVLWKKRQKEVLDAMVRLSYIKKDQADAAYKEELVFNSPSVPLKAPHFVMYVKDLLVKKYGLSEVERGGLQIKTSLDLQTQAMVEKTVADEVANDVALNIGNGAALVTNPQNGDVLAMVGSKNYFDKENDGNVNITTSLRQPGSTIKLITYTLGLSEGLTEATLLDDSPLTIVYPGAPPYVPVNYDGQFRGKVTLRMALGNSFNIPAVRLAQKYGVEKIVRFGREMGVSSWTDSSRYGISITLGGAETTMTDLATAFGTIANKGKRIDLDPVLEIQDAYGKEIYKKSPQPRQVVDEGVAFIISDILADNSARILEFGANSALVVPGRRVSVKTGTTDYKRDNWTVGFAEDRLVATWVGNNDNTPMNQALASGITGAAPMWNKIISTLLKDVQESPVIVPENVIKKPCGGREAYFIKGTEGSAMCSFPLNNNRNPRRRP